MGRGLRQELGGGHLAGREAHQRPAAGPPRQVTNSAANRLISEVVQSRRRPLLGPSPG